MQKSCHVAMKYELHLKKINTGFVAKQSQIGSGQINARVFPLFEKMLNHESFTIYVCR
jgi:hypothetical protein